VTGTVLGLVVGVVLYLCIRRVVTFVLEDYIMLVMWICHDNLLSNRFYGCVLGFC
jgi:hypothetical protein